MIWKTQHISPAARNAQGFIQNWINAQSLPSSNSDSAFEIGIVGGGPKGLYALEELFRKVRENQTPDTFRVWWWNETQHFGSGPNYRADQPDYLLINYCIGHVDAWDRSAPQNPEQLNLVQWIAKNKMTDRPVQESDFASRALVGCYLQDVLRQVIQSKPDQIELLFIPEKVNTIKTGPNARLIVETRHHQRIIDHLLLATGHCYQNTPIAAFEGSRLPEHYFKSAYPIQVLDKIPDRARVGIIGWGLTFIDVALALTEGRGGSFDEAGRYDSSGMEPVMIPFSRNQLPIMPRGPVYGKETYTLQYLDEEWCQSMKTMARDRKLDFQEDVFPWLEQELKFAYYSTLLQTRSVDEVEEYIRSLPENQRFTYRKFLFPKIPKADTAQKAYIRYIEFLIEEAEKGELKSPLMAAAAVWREASPFIADLYQSGGFTGPSQQYLDQVLFGAFCRTSYGPPIDNMKKILALLKAGIIKVPWMGKTDLLYEEKEGSFRLQTVQKEEKVDYIVDARIGRPDLNQGNSTLYQSLFDSGMVKPFENQGYVPGCAAMDDAGKVIHPARIPLYFYGTNTEGVMLDNDSLSRKKNNLASRWVAGVLKSKTEITTCD